jgi:predicted transcriptional regulator
MESTTVRISPKVHIILRRLAEQSKESMQATLAKAVELYRRQIFLEKANLAFGALRKKPKAWQNELKEREAWDLTLLDAKDF